MRVLAASLLALLLIVGLPPTSDSRPHSRYLHVENDGHLNGVDIDLEDGSIILTHRGRHYETVEITQDYELYVNDSRVDLNEDQQELVVAYYDLGMEIIDYAKELGWEGAKIGASGAKLGLKAIGSIFKLIFTGYDTDDLERDLERDAEKIEARAERLEKRAEKIEDMAYELEDLAWEMNREIPELDELDWF